MVYRFLITLLNDVHYKVVYTMTESYLLRQELDFKVILMPYDKYTSQKF